MCCTCIEKHDVYAQIFPLFLYHCRLFSPFLFDSTLTVRQTHFLPPLTCLYLRCRCTTVHLPEQSVKNVQFCCRKRAKCTLWNGFTEHPADVSSLVYTLAWRLLPELHSAAAAAADCSENVRRLRSAGQQCSEIQCLPTGINAVRWSAVAYGSLTKYLCHWTTYSAPLLHNSVHIAQLVFFS